ncbi:MAG TPA: RseA family anti-sigma factor [Xanthomonadaceae bacterium]|jgi:negative regulator of sigma E activity
MSEPSMKKGISMNENELFEELSAFMDGELDAERTRFLMQRLAHDAPLRARWERWQLQSAAMRRTAQPPPAGFAERVAHAIDIDAQAQPVARVGRGLRWAGGAALAASLVIASTFVFDATHTPTQAPKVVATTAPVLPIQRTVLASSEPSIKLPIAVQAGVVTAFHSPMHPVLVREPQQRPNFAPFPQPYAIDPELAAYLQSQKSGAPHDVFGESPVRTVAFPSNNQP